MAFTFTDATEIVARPTGMSPIPKDREIWIVTEEGEAYQARWCAETKFWLGEEVWRDTNGEPASWEADEITGWGDTRPQAFARATFAETVAALDKGAV